MILLWCACPTAYTESGGFQPKYRSQKVKTTVKSLYPSPAEVLSAAAPTCSACRRQNPTANLRLATIAAITT